MNMNERAHHSVLVIEGEKHARAEIKHVLHEIEYEIEIDEVETAEEAKSMLKERLNRKYDLILADEHLPGISTGIELYRYCHEQYPTLPFLVMSRADLHEYFEDENWEDTPPILDIGRRNIDEQLVKEMLVARPEQERDYELLLRLRYYALVCLTLSAVGIGSTASVNWTKEILNNPPFVERFSFPKLAPEIKILAPPPPSAPKPFRYSSENVFTPKLKSTLKVILSRADQIQEMAGQDPTPKFDRGD